jgi:hypothetical protein
MVLLDRIELSTSSLPMTRSTTELQQQPGPTPAIRRGQARPMARRAETVNPEGLTKCRLSEQGEAMAQPPPRSDKSREDRLAEALRENLRKRKDQARRKPDPNADRP